MSYEGYEVYLCANGHKRAFDCYDAPVVRHDAHLARCPCCKELFVWWCAVNQTNGPDKETGLCFGEEIVNALKIATPAEYRRCEYCGHAELVREETYEIPEGAGHKI